MPPLLAVEDIPDDSQVIDVRCQARLRCRHLPGSIGIPAGDQTGVWTGWLVHFGTRLVLVADRKQDTAEIVTQLARIGYDDVIGVVHDLGVELVAYRSVDVDTFVDALDMDHLQVLDVRAPSEWSAGHLDGSTTATCLTSARAISTSKNIARYGSHVPPVTEPPSLPGSSNRRDTRPLCLLRRACPTF